VVFSSPMPNANYSVAFGTTTANGYQSVSDCTFWSISGKTALGFTVSLRRCNDGTLRILDLDATLDYIAIARQ
jgi:hypothetical protein